MNPFHQTTWKREKKMLVDNKGRFGRIATTYYSCSRKDKLSTEIRGVSGTRRSQLAFSAKVKGQWLVNIIRRLHSTRRGRGPAWTGFGTVTYQ